MMGQQPRGLMVLFFAEMWERFSYYGMRSLLLLYMVQSMHLGVERASAIYGLYTGLVFLTPTLGGFLADKYLGPRRAIVLGGLLMAAGHFLLMVHSYSAFVGALGLLIAGCGLFKPNVSVLVGQLFGPDDDVKREAAFGIFYLGINIGAFISPLICGTLGQRLGWHWGFGCAGLGMVVGLLVFVFGQASFTPEARPVVSTGADERCVVSNKMPHQKETTAGSRSDWRERFIVLAALAVFGQIVFWAVFEQAGSSLAIFAEESVNLNWGSGGWQIPSSWFQAANPFFIALLTPVLARLWFSLAKAGREPQVPWKFAMGLMCVALGFLIMTKAGAHADAEGRVEPVWLLGAYFFNTLGELCISPTGLATVTRLAPPEHTSSTMGAWFASMALGNFFAGQLASTYGHVTRAHFFGHAALLAFATSLVLGCLAPFLSRKITAIQAVHAPSHPLRRA